MLRVLSLFSGIGAFEVALNEESIDWELDHYCEIDKYACKSYNMIHGTTDEDNLKDVTNVDYSKIGEVDLVTYGFPCQDISLAGQQKGFVDEYGNITRSGLFFNAADVILHTKPKFAIFENVKNLTSKKFKAEFETVLSTLYELGYNTYWKVLNAKDYGIPQNRERVFGISIRNDIDHGFEFPEKIELGLRLKDMLEDNVDEKYYLSQKGIDCFKKQAENRGEDLTSHNDRRILTLAHGQSKGANKTDDICPTLDTQFSNNWHGVLLEPHINIPENTKKGYKEAYDGDGVYINRPHQKRGVVQHGMIQTLKTGQDVGVVVKEKTYIEKALDETLSKCDDIPEAFDLYNRKPINNGIAKTLGTGCGHSGTVGNMMVFQQLRIRKLTPRECWRLMGFKDKYFDRVKGVSNTQLYKQAGNSIVVDVLRAIFRELRNQYPIHFVDLLGDDDL